MFTPISTYKFTSVFTSILCATFFTNATFAGETQHKHELANPNSYILSKESKSKKNDSSILEKNRADYEKLNSSHKALAQALKRESEKAHIDNSEVFNKASEINKDANQKAKAGLHQQAQEILRENYQQLTSELVKIENSKGLSSDSMSLPSNTNQGAISITQEQIEHELNTGTALLDALKRQNSEKSGGKENDISAIEAELASGKESYNKGELEQAQELLRTSNARTKAAIASLQTTPTPSKQSTNTINNPDESTQENYNKRKESALALLTAGKRIDSERKSNHPNFVKAENMIADADKLATENKLTEARTTLDKAYHLIQNEMRNMLSRKTADNKRATAHK